MERLWPHSPAPLVAVGGAIAASWYLGLHVLGVSTRPEGRLFFVIEQYVAERIEALVKQYQPRTPVQR